MRIRIKNEFGVFEVGGGSHPTARLLEIAGIGLPEKEDTTITFEGQPGQTLTNTRVQARTITMSFDFYGNERTVTKLYRILYCPVELEFFLGDVRRRISARCSTSTDIKKIIYRKWQSITIQFKCDDPFFHDLYNARHRIAEPVNLWPNSLNDDGTWSVEIPSVATEIEKTVKVFNRGETDLYPVFRIFSNKTEDDTPAAYGFVIKNETSGISLSVDYNLKVKDMVTVDLVKRKIESSISGDITNYISDDTVLGDFKLLLGENYITVESKNANDNMYAEIEYTNNYIGAVI